MKEFCSYFFGQGDQPEFAMLTLAHFAPVLIMLGVIFLLWRFCGKIRRFSATL